MNEQIHSVHQVRNYGLEDLNMQISKIIANPADVVVYDHPNWKQPKVGDHIVITSFSTQLNVDQCVEISRLPYLTIKDITPVVVTFGKRAHWTYDVSVNECNMKFLQWHYKIV